MPTVATAPSTTPAADQVALRRRRVRLGYTAAVIGGLLFAVNGSVSKLVLTAGHIDAERLTELRTAGGWLGLATLLLLTAPRSLRIRWSEVPYLAAYGLAGAAMVQWLYFVAIERLPVGIALLFEYTAPVLVALWARFVLGEPVRRRVWAALGLALGGLALIAQVWHGLALDGLGVLAGLGAAVALAAYYLLGEHGVRTRDPLSLTCWTFLFGALFWSIMQPWWTFDPGVLADPVALPTVAVDAPTWAMVLWIVVLGTVTPYVLILYALRYLPALRVGIVGMLEPVLATVVAWVWLGEALSTIQLIGAAAVLAGIIAAQTARPAPPPTPVATT